MRVLKKASGEKSHLCAGDGPCAERQGARCSWLFYYRSFIPWASLGIAWPSASVSSEPWSWWKLYMKNSLIKSMVFGGVLLGIGALYWSLQEVPYSASIQSAGKPVPASEAMAAVIPAGDNASKEQDSNTFELPFLRKITATPRNEQVTVQTRDGGSVQLKMKVFYSEDGFFIRAEGGTAGGPPEKIPVEEREALWVTGDPSKIIGIPKIAPKESLNEVFAVLAEEVDLEHVEWIECSYVIYQYHDEEIPHPEYMCSVWAKPEHLHMSSGKGGCMSINYDPSNKRKMFSNYR